MNELVQFDNGKWYLMRLTPCEHGGVTGRPVRTFASLESAKQMRGAGLVDFRVSEWAALGT